eukprot:TRINITY_DN1385_c0_g2_i4.p1 TRINITY_DN1385_c0_g2~~TRINITY_DN1385_c0_g2_i4.p1  ORF type:complete len:255 (+),score=31.76 TRINITY_DN1385_c0_g2_i4:461-1225(+)
MGFSYSGAVSAAAYKYLSTYCRTRNVEFLRFFIFGSSHHFYTNKCCLSSCSALETPYGDLTVDRDTINALMKDNDKDFILSDRDAEEQEFSIEMQLPFLAKCTDHVPIKVVPVIVGSLDPLTLERYTSIFGKHFESPENIFIISTDMCHWGSRYKYTNYNKDDGEIHSSIEKQDHEAIELLERHDIVGFTKYLHEVQSPICGRHSLEMLMNIISSSPQKGKIRTKLAKYGQSVAVKDFSESCITFASFVTVIEE